MEDDVPSQRAWYGPEPNTIYYDDTEDAKEQDSPADDPPNSDVNMSERA